MTVCPRHLRGISLQIFSLILGACGISGDVTSMYGRRVPEISGSKIYVVAATGQNGALLGEACRHQQEQLDQYRSEVARLIGAASARERHVAGPARSSDDTAVIHSPFRDSLRAMRHTSGAVVDSLAVTLALKTAVIDSSGHFSVRSIPRGAYYLVMPGVGWWGVDGKQWPAHASIRLDDMKDACSAVG